MNETDCYETPAWCVEWFLREWSGQATDHLTTPLQALEPCAGRGSIIEACNAAGLRAEWTANELEVDRG